MPRAKSIPTYESPPRVPQPVPSTVPDLVAVRVAGITYLVPAGSLEGFRRQVERSETSA